MPDSDGFFPAIIIPLLFLVFFLTYGHALHSPFVFDDIPNIVENPHVRIHTLSYEEIRDTIFESPMASRPLAYLTFAFNYYFHETNVFSYRIINSLIHITNGLLLFVFLNITLNLASVREKLRKPTEIAFWVTLLWFVHPLHVQSVTYIVQRMNSLATLFYLLAFVCYLKARLTEKQNRAWFYFGGTFLSFFFALGSKEIAITLPFFVFLYEWFFFRDLSLSWVRNNLYLFLVLCMLVIIVALSVVGLNPVDAIISSYRDRGFTLSQRVMTEARVVLHYIDLLLFPLPSRLSLLHEFEISISILKPVTTLPALLFLNGLVLIAILIAKRERILSFCLLWFFGNLFLESSFVGLEIIFEHRTYLPSMLLGLFVILLQRMFTFQWAHRAILLTLVLLFSFWTYERNSVWADEVALWEDTLQKHPYDVRAYNSLGQALEKKGEVNRAIGYYQSAIRVDPDDVQSFNNLGILLSKQGNIESAVEYFNLALRKEPNSPVTHYNLAVTFADMGYLDDALNHYEKAHEYSRDAAWIDEDVHNNLGILFSKTGRIEEAISHFNEAVGMNPGNVEAVNNLAVAYTRKKDYARAEEYFRAAIALRADDPDLHNRLGLALMFTGKRMEAREHFLAALRINPGHQLAMENLKRLGREQGIPTR